MVLDAEIYPPAVTALSRKAKDLARDLPTALLRVRVQPPAEVVLDGRSVGRKTVLRVAPGLHYCAMRKFGYRTLVKLVTVSDETALQETLEPLDNAARERQLREGLRDGTFDPRDDDQLRALGHLTGASHVLLWEALPLDQIGAALVPLRPGEARRTATGVRLSLPGLWSVLFEPPAARGSPLWRRWWVWAAAGAAAVATAGIVAWQSQREPAVLVRVR